MVTSETFGNPLYANYLGNFKKNMIMLNIEKAQKRYSLNIITLILRKMQNVSDIYKIFLKFPSIENSVNFNAKI